MDEIITTLTAASSAATMTLSDMVVTLLLSLVFGLAIAFTYMKTQDSGSYSQSFAITLTMLPVILAVIILFVGSNVARAFSMAGTLSIIRFRSAPGDPKDIGYIFFDIGAGLACGVGQYFYGIMFVAVMCIFIFALSLTHFGEQHVSIKSLRIVIPETLDYENAFDDIMKKYTKSSKLVRVKTTDLGSLYELTYSVKMKSGVNDQSFIDELRCRNGNLNIVLSLAEQATYGK